MGWAGGEAWPREGGEPLISVIAQAGSPSAQSGWTTAAIATLVAAAVSALVALVGVYINGVRAERERRRQLYADALAACLDYQEFAYVVIRRRKPPPGKPEIAGEERIRISEALREVQARLSRYQSLLKIEPYPDVEKAYEKLVAATRRVAGGYMHDAWKAKPLDEDAGMNIPGIDYSELNALKAQYLAAVEQALSWKSSRVYRAFAGQPWL